MTIQWDSMPKPAKYDALGYCPPQVWQHGTATLDNGTVARVSGRGSDWYAVAPSGIEGRGSTAVAALNDLTHELCDENREATIELADTLLRAIRAVRIAEKRLNGPLPIDEMTYLKREEAHFAALGEYHKLVTIKAVEALARGVIYTG